LKTTFEELTDTGLEPKIFLEGVFPKLTGKYRRHVSSGYKEGTKILLTLPQTDR